MPSTAPRIAFRDLECLLVLVEELHFGRAAERLAMTQSALARTIRRLESELDVPLVTRRSPMVTPTEAGRRFADHVGPLLGALELATSEARRAAGAPVPLRIGCVPYLRLQQLQGFLGALYAERPQLDADVVYLRTSEQLARLRRRELDLGLITDTRDADGIDVEPIYPGERLAVFVPLGHRFGVKDAVTPGDLDDELLIAAPRDADATLDDRVMTLLATAGHGVRQVRRTTGEDARSMVLAVIEHHGLAIAPASTVELLGDIASLVTARPLEPAVRMPDTALAWRADPPPELRAIISAAREIAASFFPPPEPGG